MRSSPSTTKWTSLRSRASTMASWVICRSSASSSAIRIVTGRDELDGGKWRLRARCRLIRRQAIKWWLQRQRDRECRALARYALPRNGASVALRDAAAQSQADTRARVGVAAMQAFEDSEDAAGVARIEADAVVAHRDLGGVSAHAPVDADDRRHVLPAELDPVGDEVLKQLTHPQWICGECRELADLHRGTCLMDDCFEIRDHVLCDLRQFDGLYSAGLGGDSREREQIVDQVLHTLRRGHHPVDVVSSRRGYVIPLLAFEALGERAHLAQRLLQVVGGDRREPLELLV